MIYGDVKERYKLNLPSQLDEYKRYQFYDALKTIHAKLQNYRGFRSFVRVKKLPNVDYFVVNPGFVVEFDESQHFTKPREITLRNYPQTLRLGFDKNRWIKRCIELNRKDNDPPYRDEQRAWYDTIRDFSSAILNIPVIRVLAEEHVWCKLSVEKEEDVEWFKNLIYERLALCSEEKPNTTNKIKIGLAFPELGKHDIEHFVSVLKKQNNLLDLIVFPEAFETIPLKNGIKPEGVRRSKQIERLFKKYLRICRKFNLSIILGVSVNYANTSISGGGDDQYCLFVAPKGEKAFYHKHSTSKFNAFFDADWSIKTNFPVVEVKSKNLGISICHDSYISLIPKLLKTKGADIWVNISYQNVRPHVWQSVLQTRATENKVIAVCTLHRNSRPGEGEGRPQKEPYAFSETGKIKLRDLETNKYISGIPVGSRNGRIFYFHVPDYESHPTEETKTSRLSDNAQTISINVDDKRNFKIEGDGINYLIKEIDIEEFIYSPEKIWKLSLENKDKIPLFVVWTKDDEEWARYRSRIETVIKGRIIEFSTLFLFVGKKENNIFMAGYRSSNYKDSRIFHPKAFPLKIDRRYLKGLKSICKISLGDERNKSEDIYFERLNQIIHFLQKTS
jgi:hypothetical protein